MAAFTRLEIRSDNERSARIHTLADHTIGELAADLCARAKRVRFHDCVPELRDPTWAAILFRLPVREIRARFSRYA